MGPAETGSALIRRLLAEVQADRRALQIRFEEIVRFSSSAAPSEESTGALALALDRSYTALESILDRVARNLEGGPAVGEDWHRTLLQSAGLDIRGVRPAILGQTSLAAADELRRFRHFLRHAYASSIDRARVLQLSTNWLDARKSIEDDLSRFEASLQQLSETLLRS